MSYHKPHSQASTVAHNWAHKRESTLKKDTIAGSLYYEGDTIYSYGSHFPIAKHVTGKDGKKAILFTTRTYSNTTSKHLYTVRSAISHMDTIYCEHVPSGNWSVDHDKNFYAWEQEIKNIALNLPRATKPEKYIVQINQVLNSVKAYAEFFGVKPKAEQKKFFALPIEKLTKMSEAGAELIRKRKVEAKEYAKKQAEERAKREEERTAEQLIAFRKFERDDVRTNNNTAFLRFNKKTKRIETSKGVEIPQEVGRRFYKWVKSTVAMGGCNGNCEMEILSYKVRAVNAQEMQIGCHTIAMSEADALAKVLKWK